MAVNGSAPSAVMRNVCSNCAVRLPSAVAAVHLSGHITLLAARVKKERAREREGECTFSCHAPTCVQAMDHLHPYEYGTAHIKRVFVGNAADHVWWCVTAKETKRPNPARSDKGGMYV